MAGMAAKMVQQYFESQNTHPKLVDENHIATGWEFNGGTIEIYFSFDEDDAHVNLLGINFAKVPEDKYESMYKVLNELNNKFILVKFVLDTKDGEITAREFDVIQLDSCGPECFELVLRMVKIGNLVITHESKRE